MKPPPWLPYVAPFALYVAFLTFESPANLVWVYPLKVLLVAVALWVFRARYDELRPTGSWRAVLVGLAAIVVWIALDPFYPKLGKITPFDPTGHGWFIAARVMGAVVIVPVMEELFWRAFLIRWIIHPNFKNVPVGAFTGWSFGLTTAMFGLEHHQWLAGMVCGALYNGLCYRRKSIFECVIAHAVSNAVLAGYVLATGDWKFW